MGTTCDVELSSGRSGVEVSPVEVKPVDEGFSSYNSSTTIVGVITPREKLRAWLLFLRPTSARNVDVDTTQEVL